MSTPTLPLDIIECIIDEIGHQAVQDRNAWNARRDILSEALARQGRQRLSTLSLVSKMTLHRCRWWKFRSIKIKLPSSKRVSGDYDQMCEATLQEVAKHEEDLKQAAQEVFNGGVVDDRGRRPGNYVRELSVNFNGPAVPWRSPANKVGAIYDAMGLGLPSILPHTTNLEAFKLIGNESLSSVVSGSPQTLRPELISSLHQLLSTSPPRRIYVSHLHLPRSILDAASAVSASVHLRSVELVDSSLEVQPPPAATSLSELEVTSPGSALQTWLHSVNALSWSPIKSLGTLVLDIGDVSYFVILRELLDQSKESLSELQLSYRRFEDVTELQPALADIAELPCLRTLKIVAPSPKGVNNPVSRIASFLFAHATIPAFSQISTLSVDIDFGYHLVFLNAPGGKQQDSPAAPREFPILIHPVTSGFANFDSALSCKRTFPELQKCVMSCRVNVNPQGGSFSLGDTSQNVARQVKHAFPQTFERFGSQGCSVRTNGYDEDGILDSRADAGHDAFLWG